MVELRLYFSRKWTDLRITCKQCHQIGRMALYGTLLSDSFTKTQRAVKNILREVVHSLRFSDSSASPIPSRVYLQTYELSSKMCARNELRPESLDLSQGRDAINESVFKCKKNGHYAKKSCRRKLEPPSPLNLLVSKRRQASSTKSFCFLSLHGL